MPRSSGTSHHVGRDTWPAFPTLFTPTEGMVHIPRVRGGWGRFRPRRVPGQGGRRPNGTARQRAADGSALLGGAERGAGPCRGGLEARLPRPLGDLTQDLPRLGGAARLAQVLGPLPQQV